MAQPNAPIRLHHARDGFCDMMINANLALSKGKIAEAINQYTEVLYKLSPGHVCALLNRSMAFIEGGYYELAVMDAYRACMAAAELQKNTVVAKERLRKVTRYLRAEQLHVSAGDRWTTPRHCDSSLRWMKSPLASIVINATPEVTVAPFPLSGEFFFTSLETRAVYRLCGALFMVGDGARKDALELIDDAKSKLQMKPWESDWLHKLGNEILIKCETDVTPTDPKKIELLGHDTEEKRKERMRKLKEGMKATTSRFAYGEYPWNLYEPKLEDPAWQEQVQAWIDSCNGKCSALVVRPEETDDALAEASKPYIELRASQDINRGDLILSEQTISNVTTSIPEIIEAKRRVGIFDYYYCNSCASLLIVPLQCPNAFQQQDTPVQSETSLHTPNLPPLTLAFQDLNNSPQGSRNMGFSTTTDSNQSPGTITAQPSSHRDFMFCRPNHLVPTCSTTCRELSDDFDNGLCNTAIERRLRLTRLFMLRPMPMPEIKTLCLRDLIFLRCVTLAINLNDNPLRLNDIVFATSGPNAHNTDREPWSYVSHVVRPIRCLQQLFEDSDTDQFLKLSLVDGWVIYTLLSKIQRSMRIDQSPCYAKRFDANGMLDLTFGPGDGKERWEELVTDVVSREGNDEQFSTWTARIDLLLNMIRIADPAKGETPNVKIVQREGVSVYAVKKRGEPAVIRAGEVLLRAGVDGTGEEGSDDGDEDLDEGEDEDDGGGDDDAHSETMSQILEEMMDTGDYDDDDDDVVDEEGEGGVRIL